MKYGKEKEEILPYKMGNKKHLHSQLFYSFIKTIKKVFSHFISFILLVASIKGENNNAQNLLQKLNRKFFIENKGQWHPDVLYLCRMDVLDIWITKYGVNFTFFKIEKTNKDGKDWYKFRKFPDEDLDSSKLVGHRVLLRFIGHNPEPDKEGIEKQEGYYNYLIGNDPSKHASFVGLYKEVIIKNIYNGIDIRYYIEGNNLRFDFEVKPGADPSRIKFKLEGQYEDKIEGGKIIFTTLFGNVEIKDLKTYQNESNIKSYFQKKDNYYEITLTNYNQNEELIIDPLVYSTYLGGSGHDESNSIAVDASGYAYVTGRTYSTNYDITTGAFQTSHGGPANGSDAFVTKLSQDGSSLQYSTYIGGSGYDEALGIAVDGSGYVYITGSTSSSNFPIQTPYQNTNNGGWDIFVTKLNQNGTALVYSTYIGGSGDDYSKAITVDGSGNAYITGYTYSTNYDITSGAFQTSFGGPSGGYDAFVTKLNSSGSTLSYSTYLGGSGYDEGRGITVDASGYAYVTGYTSSSNFPTKTPYQGSHEGGFADIFVTKLNQNGTTLVYSTYIGGSGDDYGNGIALDAYGNAYITGYTISTNYDVTTGVFQQVNDGGADAFVTKLNASGTGLICSTYIGGSGGDYSYDIAVDASGYVYITGGTTSNNYDVTPGAFQTSHDGPSGGWDVFVSKLSSDCKNLHYSTYIGGGGNEVSFSIDIDGSGYGYITGYTASTNYDITSGAYQTSYGGGSYDVFVTKIGFPPPLPINLLTFNTSCLGNKIYLYWETASEINNNFFTIERSLDAINFETVANIQGAGNSNKLLRYSYTDELPSSYLEKTLYYRLKQTDYDGAFKYSNIVGVNCNEKNEKFYIYPNPAREFFNLITTLQDEKDIEVIIEDVRGSKIKALKLSNIEKGKNEHKIDISKLAGGMYFVTIRVGDNNKVLKLVVE